VGRWAAGLALLLFAAASNGAARGADGGYADSVDRALQILRAAPAEDRAAAHQAADVLEAGTGVSQREILVDLRREPPDVADARSRLAVLARTDRSPAFVPEPRRAQQAIHSILAQPRYAAIRQGPSLSERLRDALLRLLLRLLEWLGTGGAAGLRVAIVAGSVAALALVVFVIVRAVGGGGRSQARLRGGAELERPGPDHFAEAERLAAAGDLAGAVRALAGGVAVALGDERDWELSPLTVREIFARSPQPAGLRPLLLAFEAAVYGGRAPDAEAYRQAAAAAAPFRLAAPREAAA
jgi:hypothetical protein